MSQDKPVLSRTEIEEILLSQPVPISGSIVVQLCDLALDGLRWREQMNRAMTKTPEDARYAPPD